MFAGCPRRSGGPAALRLADRAFLRPLSALLIIAGAGLTLVPVFWFLYTSWLVGPMQAAALAEWEGQASEHPVDGPRRRAAAEPGAGLVLTVPRIRLTRYVPEGASVAQLRRYGVGRITWTARPDRPGTVGIAGHRTTYGAPFLRLESLAPGDRILITYGGWQFDYTVTERRTVRPGEVDVLRATPGAYAVALITCSPLYSATHRLVVLGRLQGVSLPSPTP